MTRHRLTFALLSLLAMTAPGVAQNVCVTQNGSCPMSGAGATGVPCVCVTAAGSIQGITRSPAGAPAGESVPHYCCTSAGRIGPLPNMNAAPGKACQATTPAGLASGQACF
jgi:hypothetical protein